MFYTLITYHHTKIISNFLGSQGLKEATMLALLNANYMASSLSPYYTILYTNKHGFCAHEFIIDARPFTKYGIEAIDIAKRLQSI